MEKCYLTKENISSKANEWLDKLIIPCSRMKQFKFQPKNSALLIIDMQEFFINKKSHAYLPAAETIIPNINSIIDAYRKKGFLIIFTLHALKSNENPGIMGRWWKDVPRLDSPLSRIYSSINWKKNDITLQKSRYSAFIGTNLDKILKDMKIDTLVITGIMTHLCCESTARDAFMRDYEVYFVIDATASYNETLHVSALITLTNGFAMPVITDNILKEVQCIE